MRLCWRQVLGGVLLLIVAVAVGFYLQSRSVEVSPLTQPAPAEVITPPASATASDVVAEEVGEASSSEAAPVVAEDEAPLPSPTAVPIRIVIPSAGIDESLAGAGITSSGALRPPAGQAVWLDDTTWGNVRPGQLGTGIVAGHVVSHGSDDVFAHLTRTQVGDEVEIMYSDGASLTLAVVEARVIAKDDLRSEETLWREQSSVRRMAVVTCSDEQGFRPNGTRIANFLVVAEAGEG